MKIDPHSVTLRVPPLPGSTGERNPSWKSAGHTVAHFLSPGQGERWHAKRDGVGVHLPKGGFLP
jgi:hypothetical protein